MPSLKDLRNRIASVKSTKKITSAMKMVAAAKLKRAQINAEKTRPYAEKMRNIVYSLTKKSNQNNFKFAKRINESKKTTLLLVCSADRGLCGGFNTNIIKKAKSYFQKISDTGKTLKIITVGSKGYDQLKRLYQDKIIENISFKESKNANYFDADKVGKIIIKKFENNEFDVCTIFFNQFKNVITQIPQEQQIIPLKTEEKENKSSEENYEFEPDEDEILSNLLPKNISTQIFKAMLENSASEQGSRMTAMDNATRNAGELVDRLTIEYNRSRQAAITKELIEIISGAESL